MKSYHELVEEARTRNKEVTAAEAMRQNEKGEAVLLDCREQNEWNMAHVPGAVLIPRGLIEQKVLDQIPVDAKVIIYCASGNRSLLAADTMREMGYTDVASMAGGIRAWSDAGGPIE